MKRDAKPNTRAGTVGRVIVWTSFALALFARFVVFRFEPPAPQGPRIGWGPQEGRFRRPPAIVHPPQSEVPKDLPRLQIEVTAKDADVLRGYFWNGWRGQRVDRPEVAATVHEGDQVYTNVTLHLKGSAGSFRPFDDKPAMTLNFSKNAHGQRFHEFAKISLNNSVQDPSYLCEAITRELYLVAGVPAPRAQWATVLLNGRDLGLYVMLEGYGKEFLKHHFKTPKGNLYDGGFCQDINQSLDVNCGEHPDDRSDLDRLTRAASRPDSSVRWKELNQILDIDRFVTLLAIEVLTCNWDGYALNNNNYRIYHDVDNDRMVFMPHGLDQMFDWPPGRFSPEGGIQPHMKGLVARAVMGTADGNRAFLDKIRTLQTNLFTEDRLLAQVHDFDRRIRPTLEAYDPNMALRHDSAVASLEARIRRRVQSVGEQLSHPREALAFDESGFYPLTNWIQRVTSQNSGLSLDKVEQDGKPMLHFASGNRGGTGSWRTRVLLNPGRYRFEGNGRVDSAGVGSRLGLRASGSNRLAGSPMSGTDWVPLSYVINVDAPLAEIVLVCEFNGGRGEAWFDIDSLRLVRE